MFKQSTSPQGFRMYHRMVYQSLSMVIAFLLCIACSKKNDLIILSSPKKSISLALSDNKFLSWSVFNKEHKDTPILSTIQNQQFLGFSSDSVAVEMALGQFNFDDDYLQWDHSYAMQIKDHDTSHVQFEMMKDNITAGTLEIKVRDENSLMIQMKKSKKANHNKIRWIFNCQKDEEFLGFGEQTDSTVHRGQVIPIWVSEGGVGRAESKDDPNYFFPITGLPHTSHFPLPYYHSTKGYSLWIDTSARTVFDLCSDNENNVSIDIWDADFTMYIYVNDNPLQRITSFAKDTSLPKLPVPWAFLPWNDEVFGQKKVLQTAQILRDNQIPSSVMWTEDWVGGSTITQGMYSPIYQYSLDEQLYPDLDSMIKQLHDNGFKFVTYINTFVTKGTKQWDEANQGGFLVKDELNNVYIMTGPLGKKVGLVDLSNPASQKWILSYFSKAESLGVDGWMADFGEWLPYDSVLYDGSHGEMMHNQYPKMWQKLNHDFWSDARADGDYLYFTRSGYLGTSQYSPVTWAADQNTDWSKGDGLPTVLTSGLNLGLCGVPYFGHDIGGYFNVSGVNQKELFIRWLEIGAFSPIMRTMRGTKYREHWHFNSDAETMQIYKKYAEVHTSLFPYLYSLATQSQTTGLPIMMHSYLIHPDEPRLWPISDQYYLGHYIYISPIISENTYQKQVYLPSIHTANNNMINSDTNNIWFDYFTKKKYQAKQEYSIDIPLDSIGVFVPAGAILPHFDFNVQTLSDYANTQEIMNSNVMKTLRLQIYLGGNGEFTLFDDTKYSLEYSGASKKFSFSSVEIDGILLSSCKEDTSSCFDETNKIIQATIKSGLHTIIGLNSQEKIFAFHIDEKLAERKYSLQIIAP